MKRYGIDFDGFVESLYGQFISVESFSGISSLGLVLGWREVKIFEDEYTWPPDILGFYYDLWIQSPHQIDPEWHTWTSLKFCIRGQWQGFAHAAIHYTNPCKDLNEHLRRLDQIALSMKEDDYMDRFYETDAQEDSAAQQAIDVRSLLG